MTFWSIAGWVVAAWFWWSAFSWCRRARLAEARLVEAEAACVRDFLVERLNRREEHRAFGRIEQQETRWPRRH